MNKLVVIFLLFMLAIPQNGDAQAEDKLGSWYIYNGFFLLSPKFELMTDVQFRTYEPISNLQTFLIRPYVSYYFSKQFNAGMSLEYHRSLTYAESKEEKQGSNEIRLTLQGILFNYFDRVTIQHRYRLEQRWIDSYSAQRARYRIQATIPINNKSLAKGTWFINVFNEFFINLGPELELGQNWLYLAPGYQINKELNLQVGYMLQSIQGTNFNRLQFFLTQRLSLYNK